MLESKGDALILKDSDNLTSTVSARAGHSEQVYKWRMDQFRRLGFSYERSHFLADTNIEVGRARKMHSQGCSLDLIEEILLGTCFAGEDERWYAASALVYEEEEQPVGAVDDGA